MDPPAATSPTEQYPAAPAAAWAAVQRSRQLASERRLNSFDGLRLAGAAAVLVSHSFALTGHHEPKLGRTTLGTIGILMFFGISGFLITQSWCREPRLPVYVAKRALRILPALVVVVVLSALLIGPLVTTRSLTSYFSSSVVWKYIATNVVLVTHLDLPGVFTHNRYPTSVNGSLWTLPIEAHAYIVVALLGLLSVLRHRVLALAALVLVSLAANHFPAGVHGIGDPLLIRAFAWGSVLYLWREAIPWHAALAGILVAVAVALSSTRVGPLALQFAIPYLAVYVAHRLPNAGRPITRHGDFSYGLYLWAFPFQQMAAHVWPASTAWEMVLLVLPAAAIAAVASWRLVEAPALGLKQRLGRRAPPVLGAPTH